MLYDFFWYFKYLASKFYRFIKSFFKKQEGFICEGMELKIHNSDGTNEIVKVKKVKNVKKEF